MSMIKMCLGVCAKSSEDSIFEHVVGYGKFGPLVDYPGSSARPTIRGPTWLAPPSLGHLSKNSQ